MEKPGNQLFTGTVRPGDEDSGVGWSDLVDHGADVLDGFGFTDHFLTIDTLLEGLGFPFEGRVLSRVLDGDKDSVEVERLLDEIECAFFDAFNGSVDVSVAGNHDNRGVDPFCGELVEDLDSVHVRHLDVAENCIVSFLHGHLEPLGAVLSYIYLISFVCQYFF